MPNRIIGIVGGVGPQAGIDLASKIISNTKTTRDQDHVPFLLASIPERIIDRTDYLLRVTEGPDPANAICQIIRTLVQGGAEIIGIPCNTAHAPEIFDSIKAQTQDISDKIVLVNMIDVTKDFIVKRKKNDSKIGLLATLGTYKTKVYPEYFKRSGIELIEPELDVKKLIHDAIYNPIYGIKAVSSQVTRQALDNLRTGIIDLVNKQADTIIMGCTEIPFALKEVTINNICFVDPTALLARRLISLSRPERLILQDEESLTGSKTNL